MDEEPTMLHVKTDTSSRTSPYVKRTGKMTRKETGQLANKNWSILNWARNRARHERDD